MIVRGRTTHLKPLPQLTSYVLTRRHLTDKIIIHHQRDNLIFLMLLNRFSHPNFQSDLYISLIPEKIDTAAIVSVGANNFKFFSHLRAICCRHLSCKGESKTNKVLKLRSILLSPSWSSSFFSQFKNYIACIIKNVAVLKSTYLITITLIDNIN